MKKQNSVLRIVLFIAGLIVFAVVPRLLMSESLIATWRGTFISIIIELIYIAIALPLALNNLNIKNADRVFTGGGIYLIGAIIFSGISVITCIIVACTSISLKVSIVIEIIALFIAAIYFYLAYAAHSHIGSVAKEESEKRETIMLLRRRMAELSIKVASVYPSEEKMQHAIKSLEEGFRYLSPSEDAEAIRYESEMEGMIERLLTSNMLNGDKTNISAVEKQLEDIELLYKMRKNIY